MTNLLQISQSRVCGLYVSVLKSRMRRQQIATLNRSNAGAQLTRYLQIIGGTFDGGITFRTSSESHFVIIHEWFNKPHVQSFYSLRPWTLDEVQKKLAPYLHSEKQIRCYVVFHSKHPIGYIQSYSLKDHPWDNQDLPNEIVNEAAGIDLFIGKKECLGKGLGCEIINSFLEKHIWPFFRYCLADPDIRNEASIRLFQKCGFVEYKQIFSKDALQKSVTLQLFIKERV